MRTSMFALALCLLCAYSVNGASVMELIAGDADLQLLNGYLNEPVYADIKDKLTNEKGPFTVWAPTDAAIQFAISKGTPFGRDVIDYQITPGNFTTENLSDMQFPSTWMTNSTWVNMGENVPQTIEVTKSAAGAVQIIVGIPGFNEYKVDTQGEQLLGSNGVVHRVTSVLYFPTLTQSQTMAKAGLSTLVSALETTKLTNALDTTAAITLLAPNNQAFEELATLSLYTEEDLVKILEYHVIKGVYYTSDLTDGQVLKTLNDFEVKVTIKDGEYRFNGALLKYDNGQSINGVFHELDDVLLPPTDPKSSMKENMKFVREIADTVDLITSPQYARLMAEIDSATPTTWFAADSTALSNITSENALEYMVLTGEAKSTDLAALQFPETYLNTSGAVNLRGNGQVVRVAVSDAGVTVGEGATQATVTHADIVCSNGVIHVVSAIPTPPLKKPSELATELGFTTLVSLLATAGLADAVDTTPGITILAPSNEAFLNLDWAAGDLSESALKELLLQHVLVGPVYSTDLKVDAKYNTLNGETVSVCSCNNGTWMIDNASITSPDHLTPNGVVHAIDAVLLPQTKADNDLWDNMLLEAEKSEINVIAHVINTVDYAPVKEWLSTPKQKTFLAPTNAALTAAGVDPTKVAAVTEALSYHTLSRSVLSSDVPAGGLIVATAHPEPGLGVNATQVVKITKDEDGVLTVNGQAKITTSDVVSKNGVIQAVDAVLAYPGTVSSVAAALNFTELSKRLVASGLLTVVDTTPSITVFAPTNLAFDKADPKVGVNNSTSTIEILENHVFAGVVYSTNLKDGQKLTALSGKEFTVSITDAGVKIGNINIIDADALVQNGAVHVIDGVLGVTPSPPKPSDGSSSSVKWWEILLIILAVLLVLLGCCIVYKQVSAKKDDSLMFEIEDQGDYQPMDQ